MERKKIITYLDNYLRIAEINDYGPQGLQVETNNQTIDRIALAVDTAPPVITAAAEWQADMLLVHHGVLWRSVERIAGPLGERVRLLMQHGINLYAAHLPLDAHQEVGNNAILAQMLGVEISDWWGAPTGVPLGVIGPVTGSPTVTEMAEKIELALQSQVRVLAHGPEQVRTMAIMSGFGAEDVATVKALGADTYLTGETSHANYWAASDYGVNVIYAGHYATETVGVQALGQHLANQFDIEVKFFDFPTNM
jgi:dinuclear metal center YbgI/SA1388 family protein